MGHDSFMKLKVLAREPMHANGSSYTLANTVLSDGFILEFWNLHIWPTNSSIVLFALCLDFGLLMHI